MKRYVPGAIEPEIITTSSLVTRGSTDPHLFSFTIGSPAVQASIPSLEEMNNNPRAASRTDVDGKRFAVYAESNKSRWIRENSRVAVFLFTNFCMLHPRAGGQQSTQISLLVIGYLGQRHMYVNIDLIDIKRTTPRIEPPLSFSGDPRGALFHLLAFHCFAAVPSTITALHSRHKL